MRCWTQQIRERHHLTRPPAARRLQISKSLLKQIETRPEPPTPEAVALLITGYELDTDQTRFTRELARRPVVLPSLTQLRTRIATPARQARLDGLDSDGVLAAYTDPLWHLIAANQRFREAFPGLEDFDDNLALWFFQPGRTAPSSRQVVVDRDGFAAYLVATLRPAFGVHRESPRAREFFDLLDAGPEFRTRWDTDSITVAYGRRPDDLLRLRDLDSGERYDLTLDLGPLRADPTVRFSVGYRRHHPDRHGPGVGTPPPL
nr:helix-turn-helix domain-containing protein [Nocardia bovistercoris]